jgi:hypothetical protein
MTPTLVAAAEQPAVVVVQLGDDAQALGVAVVPAGAARQQKQKVLEGVHAAPPRGDSMPQRETERHARNKKFIGGCWGWPLNATRAFAARLEPCRRRDVGAGVGPVASNGPKVAEKPGERRTRLPPALRAARADPGFAPGIRPRDPI